MSRSKTMQCWGGCGRQRRYPDEFPVSYWAVCWFCTSQEKRVLAAEFQVPRRLRWWRTELDRGFIPTALYEEMAIR